MSIDEWFPEPKNDGNKEYLEKDLDNNPENSPYAYSTINESFHRVLTEQANNCLNILRRKSGTCIELMGGVFRNGALLKKHFSKVEVIERNATMVKEI